MKGTRARTPLMGRHPLIAAGIVAGLLIASGIGGRPALAQEPIKIGFSMALTGGLAQALKVAQYAYVLENGRIVLDGDAQTIQGNADIREFYLGLTEIGKKSYREVKYYRRRKRWLA